MLSKEIKIKNYCLLQVFNVEYIALKTFFVAEVLGGENDSGSYF